MLVNVFNIKESMNSKNETCRYRDLDNHKITIKANKENYYKMGVLYSNKYIRKTSNER